jgi:coronin-1B/1C/6
MQFSKMSDRQVALWETGSLGNLKTEAIDSSASVGWPCYLLISAADRWLALHSGVMMPFFAEGNDVLFLAGKG